MDSIPHYLECREDPSRIEYPLPMLEDILKSTSGVVVYQEQVMSIFRTVAGYSFGHADIVRRAMSKKKHDVLEAERTSFIEGASERGIDKRKAEKLFDDMISFANYAFNKSHAAAYSIISYRTAYLKAHYPREYFAALLTSVLGNMPKIAEYISDLSKLGIGVLPPDINKSDMYFHVSENNIRFGLLAVKNVGQSFVANTIRERKRREFSSFDDFVQRMSDYEINKRQVESLIKSGAMDHLGNRRSQLLASYETMIDGATSKKGSNIAGQLDFFSMAQGISAGLEFKYPDLPELSLSLKLSQEKEATGLYFSGHPLDSYREHTDALEHREIVSLGAEDAGDRKMINIVGVVNDITVKTTRNGEKMAFFTLGDRYGEIECIAFSKTYSRIRDSLARDTAVAVTGNVQARDDEDIKFIVGSVEILKKNGEYRAHITQNKSESAKEERAFGGANKRPTKIYLRVEDLQCEGYKKAKNLVEIFEGEVAVVFYDNSTKQYHASGLSFDATEYTVKQLSELLGAENVVLK